MGDLVKRVTKTFDVLPTKKIAMQTAAFVEIIKMHFWFLFVLLFCSVVNALEESHFDVTPGGSVHEFESSENGFKCRFTYACQGGTNEDWVMSIDTSGDQYTCQVERPSGMSYLFFQQFKLSIDGADIQDAEAKADSRNTLKVEE